MKLFKNSYWIKSGFYSISHRFSVLIFGFGSFFFLIRYFPKEQFGVWALFMTITTIVEMSRSGLIQNALIKLIHSNEAKDQDAIVTGAWVINFLYSLLVYVLLVLSANLLSDMFGVAEIKVMFYYYGLTMMLLVPFSQFNYLQQANFSFSGIFWSTAIRQGLFFCSVLVIYFLKIPATLVDLVYIQVACTLFGLISAFFSARRYLTHRLIWDITSLKKVLTFGRYVMGTNICSLFFKSVDQLFLGVFLSPVSVAIYNSAIRLSNLIEYPSTSIAEIVYPQSTSRIQQEGDKVVKMLYEKSVGFTLALTIPIVLITFLFADQIILLIAGANYMEAAVILKVTIMFGLFTPFSRQFGTVMDSSGRPHVNFRVVAAGLVLNVIINAVAIKYFGLMGAAYGTLLSNFLLFAIGILLLKRFFQIELRNIIEYMVTSYADIFNYGRKMIIQR